MHNEQDEIPLQDVTKSSVAPTARTKSTSFFLYLIAANANLLSFATGASIVWVNPVLPQLDGSKNLHSNPLGRVITPTEASWIASLSSLGATFGPLAARKIADNLGRKKTLLVTSSILTASFLITAFAKNLACFYISRFLGGVGTGSTYSVLPMFLTEIAEDHNRGALGCSMAIFVAFGMNISLIVGPYLTVQTFSLVCILPLLIFLPSFYILTPETPPFLASKNDTKNLTRSLQKLRNKSFGGVHEEVTKLLDGAKNGEVKGTIYDLWKVRYLRRALIISFGLSFFQQGSGFNVIVSYMPMIFQSAKVNLAPEFCVMIVGSCQLFGTILSSIVVDRAGRRFLLLCSSLGITVTVTTLGIYFHLKSNNFQIEMLSWLPILCLAIYIISYGTGIGPVPWVVMAELFPTTYRSLAASILSITCFIIAFIVVVIFPSMSLWLGMARSFFVFAIISFSSCFFIYCMVPETKGKSLQEIEKILRQQ